MREGRSRGSAIAHYLSTIEGLKPTVIQMIMALYPGEDYFTLPELLEPEKLMHPQKVLDPMVCAQTARNE